MKKNGFTLVELLAVIIILGIIALITIVSVNNTISDSKSSLSETQIKNVEEAAKSYYLKEGMDIDDKCVNVSELIEKGYIEGNSVIDPKTKEEMTGSVKISYVSNKYSYQYHDYSCYSNGEVVYFDVSEGNMCSSQDYHEDNSKTGYNGITKTTENQTSCLKFYAFNDEGEETLNLLLDHNTTNLVRWSSEAASSGPKEVVTQLKEDTTLWKGVIAPVDYSNEIYTVDYSNSNARLITANEIAKITGNTSWDEKVHTTIFFFDSNTTTASTNCTSGNTTGCKYGWLYDRTSSSCVTNGCYNNSDVTTSNFWTSSSFPKSVIGAGIIRYVSNTGQLAGNTISSSDGVRPVIEVTKNKLK